MSASGIKYAQTSRWRGWLKDGYFKKPATASDPGVPSPFLLRFAGAYGEGSFRLPQQLMALSLSCTAVGSDTPRAERYKKISGFTPLILG